MIASAARGAWSELDAKLRPFIARRVCSPSDVDDVVQDVFLKMQRGLDGLRDDQSFGPWAYRIARSAIADHHRAASRHRVCEDEPDEDAIPQCGADEEDGTAAQELAAYVATFVSMLDSPYREALTLTELEGLTQREAASMLGISLSAMKSRVQRGREHLRVALEACCNIALDVRGRVIACEPRPDGCLPDCRCR